MRTRLMILTGLMGVWAMQASAHDFWIEPTSYTLENAGAVSVYTKVGHGAEQSAWPISPHRIVGLRSLGPGGLIDHQSSIQRKTGSPFEVTLSGEGVHIVFLESTNSFSALEGDKFDNYIKEEGVLPLQVHRAQLADRSVPGRELYSRRGKTLIKVGAGDAMADDVTKPVGMTLEIVPKVNPFQLDDGEAFPFHVEYHGQPVSGATIHVTKLDEPDVTMQLTTDPTGMAQIAQLQSGSWMLHTVWGEPVEGLLNNADYVSVFSSLTFEID